MSHENGGIQFIDVINPCIYGVVFDGLRVSSLVGLLGVVPPELNVNEQTRSNDLLRISIFELWKGFNSHIKEFISSKDRIEFERECSVDGISFGSLILYDKNERISLNDYLILTTICAQSANPREDALIIKTTSLKPSDLCSSLSSSDESSPSSIEIKRKLKTRSSGLKKPQPLRGGSSRQVSCSTTNDVAVTSNDKSIIEAFLSGGSLSDEFVHRYSATPQLDLFSHSTPIPRKEPLEKPIVANKAVFENQLNDYLCRGETEITEDYKDIHNKWVKNLASSHSGVHYKDIEILNKKMSSSSLSDSSQGARQVVSGRGRLLAMLRGDQSNENVASASCLSGKAMGRGQYLKSSVAPPKGGGRGRHLLSLLNRTESSSKDDLPQFGPLKKVFSMDVYGGSLRTTTHEDSSTSDSGPESSNRNSELNNSSEKSSSTSMESVKSSSVLGSVCRQDETVASDLDDSSTSTNPSGEQGLTLDAVITSDCPVDEYLERILAFAGLTHGKNYLPPVNYYTSTTLNGLIVESLKCQHVKDLTRSQSYAIPNILARRNVCVLSSSKSGKTVAATISLLSLMCDRQFYCSLKEGFGPRAVYIASCAQTVNHVAALMKKTAPHLVVISTYGGGSELENMEALVNGCDILVSTPRCWLRLLSYKWITSANRLCHLYLDDFDSLTELYMPELTSIIQLFYNIKIKREGVGIDPQLVIIGETWNPTLSDIVTKRMDDPLLCCTSFLEASLYTHIRPKIHIISPLSKVEKMLDLLQDKDQYPSIIMCNDAEEVHFIRNLLFTKRKNVLVAQGNMVFTMKRDIHVNWQNSVNSKGAQPLLIACDDVLVELGINNAQWLLHYSIPLSKTNFDYRFSTIKSHFVDRLANSQSSLSPDCQVDILVDHTVEQQLPDLVNFMQRLKTNIPPEIISAVDKINHKREIAKSSEVGLCENLLLYGKCRNQTKCVQQHCINYDRDKPRDLPLSGFLQLKVLKVHNPVHFSVRLVAQTDDAQISPNCWNKLPPTHVNVSLHLSKYYSDRKNRRMHGNVQVGDLACVEEEVDCVYCRVKVLKILSRDSRHNPDKVQVHYVDEGTLKNVTAINLIHLPNELRTYPQTSVDLYLSNLLPVDLDRAWSFASTRSVQKKLSSLPNHYYLVAKISFVVGYKIFIESLKAYEDLAISKCSVVQLSLRNYLLENNMAVKNPDHLLPLIQLCKEANIPICGSLPTEERVEKQAKTITPRKKVDKCSGNANMMWAHLPTDEVSTVIICNAESPSVFYVTHEAFCPLLENLEKDIAEYMDSNPNCLDVNDVTVNMICLAKYEDRWNRGMLWENPSETRSESSVLLYLVKFLDYGDTANLPLSDIAPCPDTFISRLPFQAIECQLAGLNSLNGSWPEEAVDVLYDVTQITGDDGSKIFKPISLIVKGVAAESIPLKCGKRYKVVLIDSYNNSNVIINKELVSRGLANWNPEEKSMLDINIDNLLKNCVDKEVCCATPTSSESKVTDDTEATKTALVPSDGTDVLNSDLNIVEMMESLEIDLPSNEESSRPTMLHFLANLQKKVLTKAGKLKPEKLETKKTKYVRSRLQAESENDADISELEDSRSSNVVSSEYHMKSGFFTPKTTWLQNGNYVYIRIMIPSIDNYTLDWSFRHFDFSTSYDGKRYRLYVELFGSVNPDNLYHVARGQYVELKMLKMLTDMSWPRLLFDEKEKPIWLQYMDDCNIMENILQNSQVEYGELASKHFKLENTTKLESEILPFEPDDNNSENSDIEDECYNKDYYDPLA